VVEPQNAGQAPAVPELEQLRLTRREIIELRAGRKRSDRKNRQLLVTILRKLGYLLRSDSRGLLRVLP